MNVKSFNRIEYVKTEWVNIYNSNQSLSPFQSYEWNLALERKILAISNRLVNYIRDRWEVKYYIFDFGDNIVIAPIIVSDKMKEIAILGQQDMSDYLSFIYLDTINPSHIVSSIQYLIDKYYNHKFIFDRINESNERMFDALKQIDNNFETKNCVKIPVVQDLLATVKSDARRYAKQGYKRLEDDGLKLHSNIFCGRIDSAKVKLLYEHFLDRYAHKFNFSTSQKVKSGLLRLFYQLLGSRDMLKYYCELESHLYLFNCEIGECLAAYMIGRIKGNILYILRISIDDKQSMYRPGILLIVNSVNYMHSLGNNIEYVDFSRGDESYKINYGGQIHSNYCFILKSNLHQSQ